MKIKIPFNVNDYVYVKLNEKGIDVLKKNHRELKKQCPSLFEFEMPEVDKEGYTRYQLHRLMEIFGKDMIFFHSPFDTNMLIDIKTEEMERIFDFRTKLLENIKDLDPEYSKTVSDNFWNLI